MWFRRRSLVGIRILCGRLGCWAALTAAVAMVSVAGFESPAFAQAKKPAAKSNGEKEEPKIPPPEDLELVTSDGLVLTITYYPGANREGIETGKGKKVIPIVLLHGLKQSRKDYKELALGLQSAGFAVIAPDLRGHGDSTRKKGASRDETLDATKMTPGQFAPMVTQDMKAVKDFLWEKNNAGELNIDKLCIVGSEMGASVALGFAAFDSIGYGSGSAYYGSRKLGRFVKAIVLISPKWAVPGLPLQRVMKDPTVQSDISLLILVGKQDPKALTEAKRIHGMFERWHPEPTGEDKVDKQTLFLGPFDTKLQGTKLLDPGFNVQGLIADFVYRRLVKSDAAREWTWKERKYPND
jgi:pimeloyl-ACP methyl ester carboxylesterase